MELSSIRRLHYVTLFEFYSTRLIHKTIRKISNANIWRKHHCHPTCRPRCWLARRADRPRHGIRDCWRYTHRNRGCLRRKLAVSPAWSAYRIGDCFGNNLFRDRRRHTLANCAPRAKRRPLLTSRLSVEKFCDSTPCKCLSFNSARQKSDRRLI